MFLGDQFLKLHWRCEKASLDFLVSVGLHLAGLYIDSAWLLFVYCLVEVVFALSVYGSHND